jgi:hypothetical protein
MFFNSKNCEPSVSTVRPPPKCTSGLGRWGRAKGGEHRLRCVDHVGDQALIDRERARSYRSGFLEVQRGNDPDATLRVADSVPRTKTCAYAPPGAAEVQLEASPVHVYGQLGPLPPPKPAGTSPAERLERASLLPPAALTLVC